MFSDTTQVGKNISTKAVGVVRREDITLTYKYAEGTAEERAALTGGSAPSGAESVHFSVKFSKEIYNIGETIVMEVTSTAKQALKSGNNIALKHLLKHLFNHSNLIVDFYLSLGPVSVSVVVEHVEYNGVRGKEIKQQKKDLWGAGGYILWTPFIEHKGIFTLTLEEKLSAILHFR